jgi:hypothetical protein
VKIFWTALLSMVAFYLAAYGAYRTGHEEVREGRVHVVYPHNQSVAYHVFRPMAHLDEWLTGRPSTVATDIKWAT